MSAQKGYSSELCHTTYTYATQIGPHFFVEASQRGHIWLMLVQEVGSSYHVQTNVSVFFVQHSM